MKKSEIKTIPEYYQKYVDLADDGDLLDQLKDGGIELFENNFDLIKSLGLKSYAQGKWSANEMIEHLIDTERIFQTRCLRFARLDKTELAGYSENDYALSARSNQIAIEKLLADYKLLRASTYAMFSNFSDEELMRTGTANGQEISVLAMGFIFIGHPVHHFNVLQEKYFPLI